MKVGDEVKIETVNIVASRTALAAGEFRLKHPRCGAVVVRFESGKWVVASVERPDGSAR